MGTANAFSRSMQHTAFNKRVRQEVLDAWLFDSLAQAQQILEGWRIEFNTVRSHESLGKKMPLAFLSRGG